MERVRSFLALHAENPEALDLLKEIEGFLIVPRLNWLDIPGGAFEAQAKTARKTMLRAWVWEDESGTWNWDIHEGIPMLRSGEEPTFNAAIHAAEEAAFALGLA